MEYYLLNITFFVFVPNSDNKLNYKVDETRLVKASNLTEAVQKIRSSVIPLHRVKDNKMYEGTVRVEDLTII